MFCPNLVQEAVEVLSEISLDGLRLCVGFHVSVEVALIFVVDLGPIEVPDGCSQPEPHLKVLHRVIGHQDEIRLPDDSPWKASIELALARQTGRPPQLPLHRLATALCRWDVSVADNLLREARALSLPPGPRVEICTNVLSCTVYEEEAAHRLLRSEYDFALHQTQRLLWISGHAQPSMGRSPTSAKLLCVLMVSAPSALATPELFGQVWGCPERHGGYENLVYVSLTRLRQRLGSAGHYIENAVGGYRIAPNTRFLLVK